MEKDWIKIYSTTQNHKINIAKALLKKQNIDSIEMNRQDSFYITLGEIELYVQKQNAVKAKYILNKNNL